MARNGQLQRTIAKHMSTHVTYSNGMHSTTVYLLHGQYSTAHFST